MKVGYSTFQRYLFAAAAVAGVAVGAPVQAATVVGAKSITVTSALSNFLQVAELLAFDFNGVNVALAANGGVATASSQYYPDKAPQGGPGEANDGIYPADYDYTYDPATGGVFHSGGVGPGEFLTITFAAPVTLASVEIWGRGDCCKDRDWYNLTIHDADGGVLFSGQLDARTAGFDSITFDAPVVTPPDEISPAPEPSAWAMMILGFGGAGALLRRGPGSARPALA